VTIGSAGFVDVPVILSDTHVRGGVNHFMTVIQQPDGLTSRVSNTVVVALNDVPTGASALFTQPAGDFDSNGAVDAADYDLWRGSFGESGDSPPADGNGDGEVSASDYVVWRKNLDAAALPITKAGATQLADVKSVEIKRASSAAVVTESAVVTSSAKHSSANSLISGQVPSLSDSHILDKYFASNNSDGTALRHKIFHQGVFEHSVRARQLLLAASELMPGVDLGYFDNFDQSEDHDIAAPVLDWDSTFNELGIEGQSISIMGRWHVQGYSR
jgi:hypothetical protein